MDEGQTLTPSPSAHLHRVSGAKKSLSFKKIVGWVLFYALLLGLGLFMVLPLIWMISIASKPLSEVFVLPINMIPQNFALFTTIASAVHRLPVVRFYFNSAFVGILTTIGQILFCSLAGFGFAKYHFWGREVLFTIVLSVSMVPFIVLVIPLFVVVRDFGWLDSYTGLIVPSLVSPFGIFLMRQFIRDLPDELIDAARIDGSSEFGIYARIILPLIKPAIATLAIISFLASWDSFLWPLVIITSTEMYPLTLGLGKFQGEHYTIWNELMAVALVSVLPSLLVFIIFQRYFVKGIVLSGIKG
jgi:ABC-type glycerol-3-phosphate transport system permease component